GWKLENSSDKKIPTVKPEEVLKLQQLSKKVDLSEVMEPYVNLIHNLRNTGIKVSDRRAVKCQNLIAASAVISGRDKAILSDLWVLKYIWDTEEQIEVLAGIVNTLIETDEKPDAHPQAKKKQTPNAEVLMQEVNELQIRWKEEELSFDHQNIIKDKLRYIQSRSNWVVEGEPKDHLQEQIDNLWKQMLETT
ncbi:MAG: ATPase, partial [Flavobacteriales bacterium]|nr:ATPase [Flavobacteriales bacterium]